LPTCATFGAMKIDQPLEEAPAFFYESALGNRPIREWMLGLTVEDRKVVAGTFRRSHSAGRSACLLSRSRQRPVGSAERPDCWKDRAGDLLLGAGIMVLLHGFVKKTQKTPVQDLGLALKRMTGVEMTNKRKGKVGSSFDGFLAEQGILEECEEQAIKQILADQIKAAMERDRLTKAAMAIRMQTSRRALDRLLEHTKTSVTLHTLQRAAVAIGRQLRLELI
jgi:antitoxin HicB